MQGKGKERQGHANTRKVRNKKETEKKNKGKTMKRGRKDMNGKEK